MSRDNPRRKRQETCCECGKIGHIARACSMSSKTREHAAGKLHAPGPASGGKPVNAREQYPLTLLSLPSCANYRVHGKIHSIVTVFTIDTGATVSLVRQDVAVNKNGGLQLVSWLGQTLVGVNGSPLHTHGQPIHVAR